MFGCAVGKLTKILNSVGKTCLNNNKSKINCVFEKCKRAYSEADAMQSRKLKELLSSPAMFLLFLAPLLFCLPGTIAKKDVEPDAAAVQSNLNGLSRISRTE